MSRKGNIEIYIISYHLCGVWIEGNGLKGMHLQVSERILILSIKKQMM